MKMAVHQLKIALKALNMVTPCITVISCLQEIGLTASRIARGIRGDSILLKRLTEEKGNEGGWRDFKTLADVLIQEMARFKMEERFPALKDHVYGEENGRLCTNGEDVHIVFGNNRDKTRCALNKVLNNDAIVTEALINLMHNEDVGEADTDVALQQLHFSVDLKKFGVWIDPIDGTNVYVSPQEVVDSKFSLRSLKNVTILIGLFDQKSGCPVMGYINQPFHTKDSSGWKGRSVWGVKYETNCTVSSSIPSTNPSAPLQSILCTNKIEDFCTLPKNVEVVPSSGAGYKGLCVILGEADLFVGKGNYMWDTCGVQAILSCLGGGVVDFKKLRKVKDQILQADGSLRDNLIKSCQIQYIAKESSTDLRNYLNQGDTVCYRNIDILLEFIKYVK